jgi:hypothetical protein
VSIAILNEQKCLFLKKEGQEDKIGCGRGEDIRKGCRRVNVVEISCIHV